jgi:hypothetical protein
MLSEYQAGFRRLEQLVTRMRKRFFLDQLLAEVTMYQTVGETIYI